MTNSESETANAFLTADWRTLAMLNYEIDPDLLHPYVPAGTELDTHDGILYASVVGFLFLNTRVLSVPIPFHRNFEEVNLRFYVRRRAPDGWRRGVVFIKEIVPRRAIAAVARALYNENYVALPMRHTVQLPEPPSQTGAAEIGWRSRSQWNSIRVEFEGDPALPESGSDAEFITEHYWGYTRQRDGGTIEYRVEHPQWPLWRATHAELACNVREVYGSDFVEPLSARPVSAFVAAGSEVSVYAGRRIGLFSASSTSEGSAERRRGSSIDGTQKGGATNWLTHSTACSFCAETCAVARAILKTDRGISYTSFPDFLD